MVFRRFVRPQAIGGRSLRPLYALGGFAALAALSASSAGAQVLFQQFTYPIPDLPANRSWWQEAGAQLPALRNLGVYAVWNPVPVKGGSGKNSMGYDPYDLYDLGSKDQKGTIPTRFGTKDQYLAFIAVAHANGLRVYSDVVLNHTGGADKVEENPLMARLGMNDIPDPSRIPKQYLPPNYDPARMTVRSWTRYLPKGASGVPGSGRFTRDWHNFHPTDVHPDRARPYHEKEFGEDYCFEAQNGYVSRSLSDWGAWFRAQTGVDGYRLDAVKIIEPSFADTFAQHSIAAPGPKTASGVPFFLVGEFWDTNQKLLGDFQAATHHQMSLFDFGLFYALWDMTNKPETFDMHTLLNRRLVDRDRAVAFVSNHDVDRFQPINRQKRSLPYAITMVMAGRPSIFYSDFFAPEDKQLPAALAALVKVHNRYAVGRENIRLVDKSALVIEREGNLLAAFNSGGDGAASRTVTVPTAFGGGVALRAVGLPSGATPSPPVQTDATGAATVTVPAGGYVLLVRASSNERTNPDRFAPAATLPTTQTWELADDLDTGRLAVGAPKTVNVTLAAGSVVETSLRDFGGGRNVTLELQNNAGAVLSRAAVKRGGSVGLKHRVGAAGIYRVVAHLLPEGNKPVPPTGGHLTVTYTAPAALP